MTKNKLYYRESIVSFLQDISAESPSESFDELVCAWFDDLYLPGSDPEGYNPGVHEKGIIEFNNCLHSKEIQALELFHQTFSVQLKNITDSIQYQEMATNKYWQKIKHAASKALEAFNNKNSMG